MLYNDVWHAMNAAGQHAKLTLGQHVAVAVGFAVIWPGTTVACNTEADTEVGNKYNHNTLF